MKSQRVSDGERTLAVFIDFENLALGFGNRRDRFNIDKVLERLVEKGKIVYKKAYADWSRFGFFTTSLHEAAVELVEIPKRMLTGKNSADIRMCVDAMDLAFSKDHIDTFVVVSGDSDFSPLVSKLKEHGKHVIGLGLADSTSDLLRDNCDEFIYYEDLDRASIVSLEADQALPEAKKKMFALMLDSLLALRRENKELIFSSMVKDTMKRKKPSFNEEYHGYRTFSELLEDAQKFGIVDLDRHKASGTYVVTRFGSEPRTGGTILPPTPRTLSLPPAAPAQLPPAAAAPPERERTERRAPRDRAERAERRAEMAAERRGETPVVAERRPDPVAEPAAEPILPRKVVTLPSKAAVPPAPARPPERVAEPARPAATGPPVRERDRRPAEDAADDRVPLGRALIDEIDDDLDEIPSYRPQKSPKPVEAKPAVKPVRAPRAGAKPAAESAAPPARRKAAAEPAAEPPRRRAAVKPAPIEEPEEVAAPVRRTRTRTPRPEPIAADPIPAPPRPAPVAPVRRPPPPPVDADDGFGSGLDL